MNELVYADVHDVPDDGFRAHLDNEDITDYLIVHDDETIGFVTLREGRHPSRQYSKYLRIVNIAIDEDDRRRGRGTAVVERVKELARERGCGWPIAARSTRGVELRRSAFSPSVRNCRCCRTDTARGIRNTGISTSDA